MSDVELVRSLIAEERADGRQATRRLNDAIADLADTEHELLGRFLAIKEVEDRARVAYLDRTNWHRKLSWRLVRAVFFFGVLSGVMFVIFGNDATIEAAIWFIGGGAGYYLCAQIVTLGRARADERGLKVAEERARADLDALASSLEG